MKGHTGRILLYCVKSSRIDGFGLPARGRDVGLVVRNAGIGGRPLGAADEKRKRFEGGRVCRGIAACLQRRCGRTGEALIEMEAYTGAIHAD